MEYTFIGKRSEEHKIFIKNNSPNLYALVLDFHNFLTSMGFNKDRINSYIDTRGMGHEFLEESDNENIDEDN